MRAVLDTNIVVSSLLFAHGKLAPIRFAWQADAFAPLASAATTEELLRVLSYPKFKLSTEDRNELLGDYLPYCTTVRIPAKAPKVPSCRDPWDVPFLQLAAYGKADFLVSGDRDLLSIRAKTPYSIVTAEAFISHLAKA
jgi:putative PIN family toxin of toxin-antitoxin system